MTIPTTGMNVGQIYAVLSADVRPWEQGLQRANQALDAAARYQDDRFNRIRDSLDRTSKAMLGLGTVAAVGLGGFVKSAMAAVESENLFTVSLGQNASAVRTWSENLRKELGLNSYEVRRTTGVLFTMLQSMGAGEQAALGMSQGLVKLSYDMASFYDLKPEEAFEKLRSGISGEIEPLRQLGITVDETTAKTWAMKHGLKGKWEEMDQATKVAVRYQLIMEQTAKAQGDLARTMDSPTNKLRVMSDQAKQLATDFGMQLLPAVDMMIDKGKELTDVLGNLTNEQKEAYAKFALWGTLGLVVGGGITQAALAISTLVLNLRALGVALSGPMLASLAVFGTTASAIVVALISLMKVYNDMKQAGEESEKRASSFRESRGDAIARAETAFPGMTRAEWDKLAQGKGYATLDAMGVSGINALVEEVAKKRGVTLPKMGGAAEPTIDYSAAINADLQAKLSGAGGAAGSKSKPRNILAETLNDLQRLDGKNRAGIVDDYWGEALGIVERGMAAAIEAGQGAAILPRLAPLRTRYAAQVAANAPGKNITAPRATATGPSMMGGTAGRPDLGPAMVGLPQPWEPGYTPGMVASVPQMARAPRAPGSPFGGTDYVVLGAPGIDPRDPSRALPTLAERAFDVSPDVLNETAEKFGAALWNFSRDRNSIKSYFEQIASENFANFWQNFVTGKGGQASQLDSALAKVGLKAGNPIYDFVKNGGAAGVISAASGFQAARASGGGIQGALAGAQMGTGVTQALGALGIGGAALGPVGIFGGAVLGMVVGDREERKNSERRARELMEAQLAELRRMNNALKPVGDYFRSANLNLLPGRLQFGNAGGDIATSYAVQSARGAR